MEDRENTLYKWNAFIRILFSPVVLIPLLLAILLMYLSIQLKNDYIASVLTGVTGSFLAAVFGAFLKEGYSRLVEESLLEKKGESAIRNIQAIDSQIKRLRKLINLFKQKTRKDPKQELEEIDRHLETMSISVASGLEDWTDVVPALKEIKAKDKEFIEAIKPIIEEIWKNERELSKTKNSKGRKGLEKKIQQLQEQIDEQRLEKASEVSWKIIPTLASGSTLGEIGTVQNFNYNLPFGQCRQCGKFDDLQGGLCNECARLPIWPGNS